MDLRCALLVVHLQNYKRKVYYTWNLHGTRFSDFRDLVNYLICVGQGGNCLRIPDHRVISGYTLEPHCMVNNSVCITVLRDHATNARQGTMSDIHGPHQCAVVTAYGVMYSAKLTKTGVG